MKKRNNIIIVGCVLSLSFLLSGCKFIREADIGEINIGSEISPPENPVSIVVDEGKSMNRDTLVEFFYGETKESLMKEGYLEEVWSEDGSYIVNYECIKDQIQLIYYETETNHGYFYLFDDKEDAAARYKDVLYSHYIENEVSKRLMDMYPKGELENCSSEEAIAACAPLAEACGYGNAKADAFIMTKEVLNNFAKEVGESEDLKNFKNAPDPDYKPAVTEEQLNEALISGNEELYMELTKQLWESKRKKRVEWSERTEAYLVVYRPILNGCLLDSLKYSLICVYVPSFGRVVYAQGEQALTMTETLDEKELITKEDAVAEALRVLKIESAEAITVKDISMVYSPRYDQVNPENEKRIVDPCWRIDYELNEELLNAPEIYSIDDGTILINAVDGRENKYARG